MPNTPLNHRQSVRIPQLASIIDVFNEISHSISVSTGTAPLETGSIITDHATADPSTITLGGVVSDHSNNVAGAWSKLNQIKDNIEILEVITPWQTYPEMILKSVSAQQIGAGMRFTLNLEEVQRVGVLSTSLIGIGARGLAIGRESIIERGRIN